MIITGIIAEFNPFHHGHAHLLSQAQGLTIVAMSGNFVQRGEPALIDKWTRAQMALEHGADLVVELPFLVSVQSADYFAQGAVEILSALGVDSLTFGTERVLDYQALSDLYASQSQAMEAYLTSLPDSLSYPQKTQAMWETFAGLTFSGQTPNHILGLAYAKACAGTGIRLNPIQRLGSGFHSEDKTERIASATAIRKHLSDTSFVHQATPAADLLLSSPHLTWEAFFPFLVYQIETCPDLTAIFQVNAELASRLKKAVRQAKSLEDLVDLVATKRYTKARIRRILTYILVGARERELPDSIRILGFSDKGRAHLKTLRDKVKLVSRIGQEPWDALSQQADRIYQLGHPDLAEQNWGRIPLYRP